MSAIAIRVHAAVLRRLGDTRRGATAIEYGLLLALVVVVAMTAIAFLGTSNNSLYAKLSQIAGLVGN